MACFHPVCDRGGARISGACSRERGRQPKELAPPLRRLAARHRLAFGTAVRAAALQQDDEYSDVLGHQYNTVTPENELKWAIVHPQPDVYDFRAADIIVAFARRHHMAVHGHTLAWYSQNPDWLLRGHFGRGSGIEGGTKVALKKGDVFHLQSKTPHQALLTPGKTLLYYVIKVKE